MTYLKCIHFGAGHDASRTVSRLQPSQAISREKKNLRNDFLPLGGPRSDLPGFDRCNNRAALTLSFLTLGCSEQVLLGSDGLDAFSSSETPRVANRDQRLAVHPGGLVELPEPEYPGLRLCALRPLRDGSRFPEAST